MTIGHYEKQGWIEEFAGEPLAMNNTFTIVKSNGEQRLILDARNANSLLNVPLFSIPAIWTPLNSPANYVMKLDLSNAFM